MSFITDLPEKNTFINLSRLKTTTNLHTENEFSPKKYYKKTYSSSKNYSTTIEFPKIAFVSKSDRFVNINFKGQQDTPGPGTYNICSPFISTSASLSSKGYGNGFISKGKRFNDTQLFKDKYQPGPGEYKVDKILTLAHSVKTSRKNQGLYNTKPSKSLKKKWIFPGPCTYNPILTEKGGYTELKNIFESKAKRFLIKTNDTPGPGTYDINKNYTFFILQNNTKHPLKIEDSELKDIKQIEKNIIMKDESPRDAEKAKEKKNNPKKQGKLKIVIKPKPLQSKKENEKNVKAIKKAIKINNKELIKEEQDNYLFEIVPNYKKSDLFKLYSPRWKYSSGRFSVPGPAYYEPKIVEKKLSFNQNGNDFVITPGSLFKLQ